MLRKIIGKILSSLQGRDPAAPKPRSSGHGYSRVASRSKQGELGGPGWSAKKPRPDERKKRGDQAQGQGGQPAPASEGQPGEGGGRRRRRRGGRGRRDGAQDQQQQQPPGQSQRSERFEGQSGEGGGRDRGGRGRGGRERGRDRDRGPRGGRQPADAPSEPIESAPVPETPMVPIEVPPLSPDNEFVDLGLEAPMAAAVADMGYVQPTPIQSVAIPLVLEGRDVIGSAQTGTGKTAAFGLPILQKLGGRGKLRCLVLEPTRELASQVDEAFHSFSKYTHLRTAVIFGGVGYGPQREAVKRGLDVIVATPGRLLDFLSQREISLRDIQFLVLDEVDRMLDMGFLPDVKRIIEMCPKERQTLFFSATIPPELEKLTSWCLRDPHTIEIGRRRSAAETVSHAFYPVIESQKFDLLTALLERTNYESVLIFCRTKNGADFVAGRLQGLGHKVAVMHSNRSQVERTEALKGFKSGKYEVMVATDVAARGLDIAGITHVINYDTPQHAEDYVHRIGRTGRAQTEGDAFTLLTEDEMKHAFAIERFIGQKVERKKIEGFNYQYSAIFAAAEGEAKNVFRSRLYRGTR